MITNSEKQDNITMLCAACGIGEDDDIKLKKCTACDLARYCSDKCQLEHLPEHEQICKKRAAELRDEILFKQPESSHFGDCPICCLPLSIYPSKSTPMECCSKVICGGCAYADTIRELAGSLESTCPFCRYPTEESIEEARMRRIKANDPFAMGQMGIRRYHDGDYKSAYEFLSKAAELGVEMDEKKEVYHLEQAAIGGEPFARYNLGLVELKNGRHVRAAKHLIIAANMGHDGSLRTLKDWYRFGLVSKEDFAAALRGHQAAVDATKSPQREAAEAFQRRHGLHATAQASTTSLKRNPEYRGGAHE
eukprot:scaffold25593_cov70-Skeletonema_dohrnii-CCMP3373.AAC.1